MRETVSRFPTPSCFAATMTSQYLQWSIVDNPTLLSIHPPANPTSCPLNTELQEARTFQMSCTIPSGTDKLTQRYKQTTGEAQLTQVTPW